MFIDSHCHLNFAELVEQLPDVLARMQANLVTQAMVISVTVETFPAVLALAEAHPMLYATVGVHPDRQDATEFSCDDLVNWAQHPKVVGIGETGLDYHWCKGDLTWQHDRFRAHIRAANLSRLPLIIHTREAGDDTLRLLKEERADVASGGAGGVIHCFTESQAFADEVLAMGFYLSFSGIVTFKNAKDIQAVAANVPLNRLLIETDAPYLAPTPHRGKLNEPSFVKHVAEYIAQLRGISVEEVAQASRDNYFRLFSKAQNRAEQ
jgi:TatD DNase family protein